MRLMLWCAGPAPLLPLFVLGSVQTPSCKQELALIQPFSPLMSFPLMSFPLERKLWAARLFCGEIAIKSGLWRAFLL